MSDHQHADDARPLDAKYPHPTEGRRYLTPAQAAEHLALSVSTLANWRCAGTGPRWFKYGGRVRYRLAELDAWVDAQQDDRHDDGVA